MSSFKNFAPMLSSLQDQADGKGTIAGSALEDFLSIAGYETPGGGGGGGSAIIPSIELDYDHMTYTSTVSFDEMVASAEASTILDGDTPVIPVWLSTSGQFVSAHHATEDDHDVILLSSDTVLYADGTFYEEII